MSKKEKDSIKNNETTKTKDKKDKKLNKFADFLEKRMAVEPAKVLALVVLSVIALASMMSFFGNTVAQKPDLTYPEVLEMLESGNVSEVTLYKGSATFTLKDKNGRVYKAINPDYDEFKKDILETGVQITMAESTVGDALLLIAVEMPMLLLMMMFVVAIGSSMTSTARQMYKILKTDDGITFDDIAGMSETKEEIMFFVDQIKNADKLKKYNARPPKGILFKGPPGTGKTMLARAVAGEAGVPFISCSGSDFIEMFVGLGAQRVRNLWRVAEANAPCVLFIDEIDAVGRRRNGSASGGAQESNQTLNALLQKMDGLDKKPGIYVIAATNRLDDLDPALLRPGRFDKILHVGAPKSKKDRDEIVSLYLKDKELEKGLTVDKVSNLMYGFSGAEIASTVNEAVLCSIHAGREGVISLRDIDDAAIKLKVQGVVTSHSSEEDRYRASVHEAGHAVISLVLGRKVAKVSVLPYSSGIGGITVQDAEQFENKSLRTKEDLIKDMEVCLGGYNSEKVLLGDISVGSSDDLKVATNIAFQMYNNYGMMGDKMISISYLRDCGAITADNSECLDLDKVNKLIKDESAIVERLINNNVILIKKLVDMLMTSEIVIEPTLEMIEAHEIN